MIDVPGTRHYIGLPGASPPRPASGSILMTMVLRKPLCMVSGTGVHDVNGLLRRFAQAPGGQNAGAVWTRYGVLRVLV